MSNALNTHQAEPDPRPRVGIPILACTGSRVGRPVIGALILMALAALTLFYVATKEW